MIKMLEPMISEIHQEGVITKRVLERVPPDKLSWTPHPKSMTLGKLAFHVASIPGNLSKLAQGDERELNPAVFDPPAPKDKHELMTTLEESIKSAQEYVAGLNESTAFATWRLKANGKEVIAMPRVTLLRTIMLNHWYHHRGQLSVYLRLLDVPVPVIYGRSADENPFG